ncbi:MAG TPA: NAD(P)-dependent oxidoreductase, partial [Tenuifilaceae bacterium]|nr:NAD(P)-dependent oxidoreductase [Tenuifilaceae bacterium]
GTGAEIKGKKLGIHAYGNVGKLVASHAKGFGMEIYAFDPFVKKEDMEKEGVIVVDSVEALYSTCDYVSLHIPANDKTKKSINFDLISKMPKGATLVNTARKEVIDEEGLIKAFEARPDLKYATDIMADAHATMVEKFGTRVFGTPKKMGAETAEANINAGLASATQIVNFIKNGDRTFQVNK